MFATALTTMASLEVIGLREYDIPFGAVIKIFGVQCFHCVVLPQKSAIKVKKKRPLSHEKALPLGKCPVIYLLAFVACAESFAPKSLHRNLRENGSERDEAQRGSSLHNPRSGYFGKWKWAKPIGHRRKQPLRDQMPRWLEWKDHVCRRRSTQ